MNAATKQLIEASREAGQRFTTEATKGQLKRVERLVEDGDFELSKINEAIFGDNEPDWTPYPEVDTDDEDSLQAFLEAATDSVTA